MKRILVGVDGSTEARAAAAFAANLARATGAQLIVAAVAFRPDPFASPELLPGNRAYEKEEVAALTKLTQGMAIELAQPGLTIEAVVETGAPAAALAELASSRDVDLVVVGHRGRGAIKRLLLGSVADRLVQICSKPVTIVR